MKRTFVVLAIVSAAPAIGAQAQTGPLPIGTVTVSKNEWTCNAQGQYAAQWAPGLTCQHAFVSCPTENGVSVATLGVTFGYATPTTVPKGTIVFFSGEDGTTPNGGMTPSGNMHPISDYAVDYLADGYQVIQTAWDFEWADPTSNDAGGNIGYAACRPATFLYWVYTNFYLQIQQQNPNAGMCMHGESAGAGAGAFALAWYGAGYGSGQGLNYLDKATFISGPPLSDVKAGCMVPNNNPQVTVCPSGQLGCGHTSSSWKQSEEYTDAINGINDWSGLPYCRGSMNTNSYNAEWKAMSIVDGNINSFNYSGTNVTAWLCSSVVNNGTMNNSSPEAQLFFQNFTMQSQIPQGLTINGVSNCGNPEEVGPGGPPLFYIGKVYDPNGDKVSVGWEAVEYDMTQDPVNSCISHHTQQ